MYEKDKRQRITLRLSDAQFNFVKNTADILGITPSDYIRMIVNSALYASQNVGMAKIQKGLVEEASGRENDETDSDN